MAHVIVSFACIGIVRRARRGCFTISHRFEVRHGHRAARATFYLLTNSRVSLVLGLPGVLPTALR